ncbi:hypothetical protein [Streptomyces sp. enrichment culture]|uniref:hypothetical protein n=1 Tax=Streptomyces sp. enrichment culture TaxID=1795815 RepID=UPI003F54F60C
MTSPALVRALDGIDAVFGGFANPEESGCGYCHGRETEYLRTPSVALPPDALSMFLYEAPGHFDDHVTVMRRLLPQGARALADGTLEAIAHSGHGLARVDWRSWPAEQSAAVEAFLHAWWQDAVTTPEPPYAVEDIFDTCVTIARTVRPFLGAWPHGTVPDAHLAHCAGVWLRALLGDTTPFRWWYDETAERGLAELRAWLSGPGAARLRAQGATGLAARAELLTPARPGRTGVRHPQRTPTRRDGRAPAP